MRIIEKIKLKKRAGKYKRKNDVGGIKFMLSSIKKGQTVIDIGAHKAGYLFWMLKMIGESGTAIAFEPQSILFHYILRLKKYFRWDNVTLEQIALSDFNGETKLFIPKNKIKKHSSPEATLVEPNRFSIERTEFVETQTLDHYCHSNHIKPDFLKIDVEGNELNVLKGGLEIISECKPKILVEIEVRHAGKKKVLETFEFLQSLGYSGHFILGSTRKELSGFSFEEYQDENNKNSYCNNFTFEIPE